MNQQEVILYNWSAADISALVKELREQGLQAGRDFDFWYQPAHFEWSANEVKHTRFLFYNASAATWFALKYQ